MTIMMAFLLIALALAATFLVLAGKIYRESQVQLQQCVEGWGQCLGYLEDSNQQVLAFSNLLLAMRDRMTPEEEHQLVCLLAAAAKNSKSETTIKTKKAV